MTTTTAPSPFLAAAHIDTPAGPLTVIASNGVVVASGFADLDQVRDRLPASLEGHRVVADVDLEAIGEAVRAYAEGQHDALDSVLVEQPGGPFSQEVWRVMRHIPAGETWSYAELAAKAGRPTAVRAVGQACATNRVAPFVPCHRVVRSDGSMGGYAYGLEVKRSLLAFERVDSEPGDALF